MSVRADALCISSCPGIRSGVGPRCGDDDSAVHHSASGTAGAGGPCTADSCSEDEGVRPHAREIYKRFCAEIRRHELKYFSFCTCDFI